RVGATRDSEAECGDRRDDHDLTFRHCPSNVDPGARALTTNVDESKTSTCVEPAMLRAAYAIALALAASACNANAGVPRTLPSDWRERTAAHLEARAQDWIDHTPRVGENVPCVMSCHTTHTFLVSRPALGALATGDTFDRIRMRLAERVDEASDLRAAISYYGAPGSDKERESRATEGVMNAATLALADRATGAEHAITRTAFDRMWQVQRADGGFDWLDFGLEPWESAGDWGSALAAMAAGAMPGPARAAHAGELARLAGFLRARLHAPANPMRLHARVMLLRAGVALPGLLDPRDRDALVATIAAAQRDDGGWSLAAWGRGSNLHAPASDSYATAFASLALCEAGHRDARAVAWLVAHRNDDGSWSGRSVNDTDARGRLYMSDAATAYAALALQTCRSNESTLQ